MPPHPTHRHLLIALALAALTCAAACAGESSPQATSSPPNPVDVAESDTKRQQASERFWSWWSDGKAELNGYTLTQPRYGQKRLGRAVLVFVTEPYSKSRHVKVDAYDANNPDHTIALKLNHVRKFQTGVYDYSVMTSVFTQPSQGFDPLEVTFSMQEWCGHVFEEAHFGIDGAAAKVDLNSYFDGESGKTRLNATGASPVVAEDALLVQLRDLDHDQHQRQGGDVQLLTSATVRRMRHINPRLTPSKVAWSDAARDLDTPSGTISVYDATYARQGATCTVHVEVPYPHRIAGWTCDDGEEARLTGTARLPYWSAHDLGDERYLEALGLTPLQVKP